MSYPKPLSEKTLAKMYREANIDEKQSEFLHKLFQASVNLYGIVVLRDLWEILKEIAEQYGMTKIKRKDLIAFSSIVRREQQPYYVYEVDELYNEEKRNELDREIIHARLIQVGYYKCVQCYRLAEKQVDKPYFIPDDLLAFAEPKKSPEEKKLYGFLRNLKVTARTFEDRFGNKHVCEHVGEVLDSFSFRNKNEEFDYKWYSGEFEDHPSRNEKILKQIEEFTSCNEAEKIVRIYKDEVNLEYFSRAESIENVMAELNEVGVRLSEKKLEELISLLVNFANNSHLWVNRGWKPAELSKTLGNSMPTTITLGPGIQQAIAEGKISREEIEEECRKRGIKLEG